MNNSNDTSKMGKDEMDDVGRLIRHAGAREPVPGDRYKRSHEKVRDHWEQVVREQRKPATPPRFLSLARAAGFVAVAAIALFLVGRGITPDPQITTVAMVERIVGEVNVNGMALTAGQELESGTVLTTSDSARIALRLATGQALRIDNGATVTFHAPDQLALDSGALYIDTTGAEQSAPIAVVTALGTARDIGTQFQVRLSSGALLVGVRDGLVQVEQNQEDLFEVNAGTQIRLASSGGQSSEPLDTQDPAWNWIESVAPRFEMDGASLAEYLAWYASETGVELVWADKSSEQQASRITLTGDLDNENPAVSFVAVQRVAPFEYERVDEQLRVKVE